MRSDRFLGLLPGLIFVLGPGPNLGQMKRTGLAPFYLGLVAAAVVASLKLAMINLLGVG